MKLQEGGCGIADTLLIATRLIPFPRQLQQLSQFLRIGGQ
jgi:hypothetical protein